MNEDAMPVPARLDKYIETEKQRHFSRDFMVGWEHFDTWEQATVSDSGPAIRTCKIFEEDIVAYTRACGQNDPLMINPADARKHSPTGAVLQPPVPVTSNG